MTITEILSSDKPAAEKLSAISEIVPTIREKYGNAEATIPSTEVVTASGLKPFAMLSQDDRLALVEREVDRIRTNAYEDTQNAEGIVLDRRIEEYISINPILNNLNITLGSEYL
jgi:flagella basal body P-ring formation protein FlgA